MEENSINKERESADIITTKNSRGCIRCLNIIGTIEGHAILSPQSKTTKYEHVLPQLVALQEDDEVDGLLILLNTVGGDVEAGLAIAEMISGISKPKVSLVLGGGHSIGVPLAVSADVSFVAHSATMTVHPMRTNGVVIGVEFAAIDDARACKRVMIKEYCLNSMDAGNLGMICGGSNQVLFVPL